MEPATVAVLAMTAICFGFCVWIERHSRRQERAPESSESVNSGIEPPEESKRSPGIDLRFQ
jgi:hypothetical protein